MGIHIESLEDTMQQLAQADSKGDNDALFDELKNTRIKKLEDKLQKRDDRIAAYRSLEKEKETTGVFDELKDKRIRKLEDKVTNQNKLIEVLRDELTESQQVQAS